MTTPLNSMARAQSNPGGALSLTIPIHSGTDEKPGYPIYSWNPGRKLPYPISYGKPSRERRPSCWNVWQRHGKSLIGGWQFSSSWLPMALEAWCGYRSRSLCSPAKSRCALKKPERMLRRDLSFQVLRHPVISALYRDQRKSKLKRQKLTYCDPSLHDAHYRPYFTEVRGGWWLSMVKAWDKWLVKP